MSEDAKPLGKLRELAGLTAEEETAVAALGATKEFAEGEVIFSQEDPGGPLYTIESGAVGMSVVLADGVEKPHSVLPAGAVFGTLAFSDGGAQVATARATEATKVTRIAREDFDAFCDGHPETAVKLFGYLFRTSAAQSRLLIDRYLRTVEWNLEITAAQDLNLRRLVEDRAEIVLELVSGKSVSGTLLQFDSSPAGHEILLGTTGGGFAVVPYHAVTTLRVDGPGA